MNYGSLATRWGRGVQWTWTDARYRTWLPADFGQSVMTLETPDRYHAKQGRSTARVVYSVDKTAQNGDGAGPRLSVYLKRHFQLPFVARLTALIHPAGNHSPATQEWAALRRVAALGIEVPDVVAVGEQIGPGFRLQSFLMLADLVGCEPLHEAMATLSESVDPETLGRITQRIVSEVARITATLHGAGVFHKDLYLCHFFLDMNSIHDECRPPRIVLIDLHRARRHRLGVAWWRSKDIAQLYFSTDGVTGFTPGDLLRFWHQYRARLKLRRAGWLLRLIELRVSRYRSHNRKRARSVGSAAQSSSIPHSAPVASSRTRV